jgi:hypothetical protein
MTPAKKAWFYRREKSWIHASVDTEDDLTPLLSGLSYVGGLRAFLTFGDFELHLVAFLQAFISFRGNRAVVNENIRAIRASDKPVAFGVIEPLYGSFQTFHESPRFPHALIWGPKDVLRS